MIYDGSGTKPYQKDVLIEGKRIAKIGFGICPDKDTEIIDAKGLSVTPGFIDMHRHCDWDMLSNPEAGILELRQGITSVVGGNCGLGIFPVTDKYKKEIYDFIEPCIGKIPKDICITDYKEYMERLEHRKLSIHVGSFVGLGTVKAAIKGYGRESFTHYEMEQAKDRIRESLESGALGISMGIMYQPECYSERGEILQLLKAASPYNRPLSCHIRGEGDTLTDSVKEIIDLCKEADISLNISHFKSTGINNWNRKIGEAIQIIGDARSRGQDITADFYPYCGGATTLISLIPPKIVKDTMEETFSYLNSAKGKAYLQKEMYKLDTNWDNMASSIGWERILISSVTLKKNQELSGMNFVAAAHKRGFSDPVELMAELLEEEKGKVGIILLSMCQEDVDTVATLPYTMLISDSLYGGGEYPHPRLYGTFPHFIRDFVMDRKILTMEEAVRKMTALPSERISLKERGRIKENYYADLLIFDNEEIKDHAIYESPKKLCTGISYMFIDGNKIMVNNSIMQTIPAEILKAEG